MSFTTLALHSTLARNLHSLGFSEPTPIQDKAIPVVMSGSDIIGLAQTGSGKTAAFLLPLIHSLLNSNITEHPRALVIAPTRELADQIYQAFKELGKNSGLRAMTLYGGTAMSPQLRSLKSGVDLVIACPGRLLDHLARKSFNPAHLRIVVLDEADHMFDMGFLPTIRKIKTFLPKQRQTLLFTATMPKEIQHLAKELVSNPKTIRVGTSGLSTTVAHNMFAVTDAQKNGLLLKVVEDLGSGSAIVFTRTKRRAKKLGEMLQEAGKSAVSLQGNLSQNKRRNAIDGFRNGQYRVLVATDIAARGIDVSQVSHVVNFDMPNTVEAYTHRTGRTGRANRLGDALSFTTDVDRQILRKIQTQLKLDIGELPIPKNLPKVAAARSSSPRTAREQSSTTRNNNPLQSRRPSKSKSRHYSKTRRAYDS